MNKTQRRAVVLNDYANRLEENLRNSGQNTSQKCIIMATKAKALRFMASQLSQ